MSSLMEITQARVYLFWPTACIFKCDSMRLKIDVTYSVTYTQLLRKRIHFTIKKSELKKLSALLFIFHNIIHN